MAHFSARPGFGLAVEMEGSARFGRQFRPARRVIAEEIGHHQQEGVGVGQDRRDIRRPLHLDGDPFVRDLIENFDARVVPASIKPLQ